MKITIEYHETKVVIEEPIEAIDDLLHMFRRCAYALRYDEQTWKDAVLDMADWYKPKEISCVNTEHTEQQTAVEQLEEKLKTYLSWSSFLEEDFQKVKQMEKEQIIKAIETWYQSDCESPEECYNQMFNK